LQKSDELADFLSKTKIGSAFKLYEFFKGKLVYKLLSFKKNMFNG
jgi:hypothetical protein